MSVRIYDDAIITKLNKWIKDPNMVVLKPNEVSRLFQIRADQNNDKPLTLPLIAVSRDPNLSLNYTGKTPLSCDGRRLDGAPMLTIQLDAIPMELKYQIDIYTKTADEGDEYVRNFIFNIVNHPKMKVLLPYNNTNIEHVCFLRLDGTVSDNSDITEHLFADEFTRWTIQVNVDDAFFFSVPVKENGKIVGVDIDMRTKTEENEVNDEIEPVDISQK